MFARCPGCSTVHPVNAAILAQNGGRVRCGKCNKTFTALESLFDDWPEAGSKPALRGELPVLGMEIKLEEAGQSRLNPEGSALKGGPPDTPPTKSRIGRFLLRTTWLIGVLAVGAIIIFKLAEFSGHPVFAPEEIDAALLRLGLTEPEEKTVYRDLELIHLVSRELEADPADPGQLRMKATIVNRAPKSQPYPDLEVILFDTGGTPLATYRFKPADYLARDSLPEAAMSPHAYLPLILQLDDPGVQAVGFELSFH
jgi:predicted Zn finger-like uncharacterized protein